MMPRFPAYFAACIAMNTLAHAAAPDFVKEVRPILEKRCYGCHGSQKQKSGLRLDLKAAAFQGGDKHAPDILPGKAAASPLIQMVTSHDEDERMPPKGAGLSSAEVEALTRWIDAGAAWPDGVDIAKVEDKRDHWSFKPMAHPVPPSVKDNAWPRGPVDQFILARLEKEGLHPAAEASPVDWLRRVSFGLTGLPPSPEQVAVFLKAEAGDAQAAREGVVEELLASPRYGERWAQHWLDVVRYADTHGFEVNTERPNAWPYRDYVIQAFNHDTPYDQFIREQIAGDASGQETATGFLVTASVLLPGQIGKDEPSKRLARQDSIDEIVTNIGQSFLGLSIGCARCHDHKFDPILQRDYYAMQAFVAGVEYKDRDLNTPEARAKRAEVQKLKDDLAAIARQLSRFVPLANSGTERPPVDSRMNTDRFAPVKAKRVRFTIRATNNLEPCLDELECFDTAGLNVALARDGTVATSSGDSVVANRHELRHINDGLYGNSHSWMSNQKGKGWVMLEFPQEHVIDRVVWGRDRDGQYNDRLATDYLIEVCPKDGEWQAVADSSDRTGSVPSPKKSKKKAAVLASTKGLSTDEARQVGELVREQKEVEAKLRRSEGEGRAFTGTFREPDVIHLLNRGDPEQPKDEVAPAVLSALGTLKLSSTTPEQQRRKELAGWITQPNNLLTARVMVNRIWQGHFGTGLVETSSDFGHNGTKPSHPELLDWLAQEFIRSGWSIKHMHRLIALSATYRQGSVIIRSADRDPLLVDADDRLLWHFPARRLEAESIRDSMLAVSGRLNVKMYGRGFDLFDKRGGLTGFTPVESYSGDGLRRMIYAHKVRREREAVFGSFDCPDAGQSTAHRRESTTPIQALDLFNSRFTQDESEALAARARREAGDDPASQVRRVYQLALSREPAGDELADALTAVRAQGLAPLCRAMYNSNEFLFVP